MIFLTTGQNTTITMSFYKELKRRNVVKTSVLYVVASWLLLQVTDVLSSLLPVPEWAGSLVVMLLVLGFFPALIFSWVYELTPEGLKLEKAIDRSQSITPETGRKINVLIIVMLALAIVAVVVDRLIPEHGPVAEIRGIEELEETAVTDPARIAAVGPVRTPELSIAVLPFVNMSDDAANEFFSDGISEEILNSLARAKDLKVVGRTSSFAFKGRNEDLRTIGEALGVSHILEGSVRKAGVKVRITAQLIKTDDGFHLWSETYDRELTDIFAIQDEIATAIFDQLKVYLSVDQHDIVFASLRAEVSAFDLYLEAKQKIYLRRRASLEQAAELLEQAIAIDPGYAPAYAQSGIVSMLLSDEQYGTIPKIEAHARAKPLLDKALALDAESADSWAGLGLYLNGTGEPEQATEVLHKALEINPSLVNARHWLAGATRAIGDLEAVRRIQEEVLVRDPLYLPGINNILDDYFMQGEIQRAEALLNRVRPYMPASRTMVGWEGVLNFESGRIADSMPYFESSYEMAPDNPSSKSQLSRVLLFSQQYERLAEAGLDEFRVYALMRLDRSDEALKLARKLAANSNGLALFRVLVQLGRYGELIDFVESRWPSLQAFEADYPGRDGWSEHNYMGLIAFSYQRLGNTVKFEEAMVRFKAALDYQREVGANNHPFAFAEAVYAVLAGDHKTALSRLTRAFEGGFTVDGRLSKFWPMFAPLDGDPRYEAIVTRMIQHLNSERAKLSLAPIRFNHKLLGEDN